MVHTVTYYKDKALKDHKFVDEVQSGHFSNLRLVKVGIHSSTNFWYHPDDEIIYVAEGYCKIHIFNQDFILNKGDMIHVSRGIPHKIVNLGDSQLKIVAASHSPHIRKIKV